MAIRGGASLDGKFMDLTDRSTIADGAEAITSGHDRQFGHMILLINVRVGLHHVGKSEPTKATSQSRPS